MESMWQYQVIRQPTAESEREKLSRVLHDKSQGIIDLAIKLFMFSQELAIDLAANTSANEGKRIETITTKVIQTAAVSRFNFLNGALDSMTKGSKGRLGMVSVPQNF